MTKRLTEKFKDERNILRKGIENIHHVGFGQFYAGEAIDKLAEYEADEEEGRLVVMPFKVGDTVYVIAPNHKICESKHDCDEYDYENYLVSWCENYCPYGYKGIGIIEDTVSHIEIRNNGICYCTTNCGYLYDDKVFLTREEAEKALKEMESDN